MIWRTLSLSDTEHGWAHGSNTVYSVIHGLTGMSSELQTCLGISWYDLDSKGSTSMYEQSMDILDQARLSRFGHDLQKNFHTIVVWFQVCSSTPVCYGLVRLNTTFTRLTGHLQGLHTVPPTFVRVWFHTIYIRYWHGLAHSWIGLHVQLYTLSCTISHGLSRSCTVSHGLVRSLIPLYTDMTPMSVFF